jgi:hypothetical protein
LNTDGIFISQLGEDEVMDMAGAKHSPKKLARSFIEQLKHQGFQRIESYTEAHGGFLAPWGYMIAFKCADCTFSRWHSNQAMIDLEIHRRSMATVDGSQDNLFRVFDGATMMGYQYPTRVAEEIFCRDMPKPMGCNSGHGMNPEIYNAPIETLNVLTNTIPNASVSVICTQDIRKGSYLALEATTQNALVMPSTSKIMQQYMIQSYSTHRWHIFDTTLFGYGCTRNYFWGTSFFVDCSPLIFLNRSCHEITDTPISRATIDLAMYAGNAFFSRNHLSFQPYVPQTNRDIMAGEAISIADIGHFIKDGRRTPFDEII